MSSYKKITKKQSKEEKPRNKQDGKKKNCKEEQSYSAKTVQKKQASESVKVLLKKGPDLFISRVFWVENWPSAAEL